MSQQQSFIILETNGLINSLIRASEHYTQPRSLNVIRRETLIDPTTQARKISERDETITMEPIQKLDRKRASMILMALFNEALSQLLRYKTPISPVPTVAQALRNVAIIESDDISFAEDFLTREDVDALTIDIHKKIHDFVAGSEWRQWDLVETASIFALVGGEDYRIIEWEQHHGHYRDEEDYVLNVDVSNIQKYITTQLVKTYGTAARQIPVMAVIAEAIERWYPLVSFKQHSKTIPYEYIQHMGLNYEEFYQNYVKQVIETFRVFFLLSRLNSGIPYTAEFAADGRMTFRAEERPKNDEDRYFHDLKISVERGDWIPESELRKLHEWERYNNIG